MQLQTSSPPLRPRRCPRPIARAAGQHGAAGAASRLTVLGLVLLLADCGRNGITFLHPRGPVADVQRYWLFEILGWMSLVVVPIFIPVPAFAWRYRLRAKADYRPDWDFSWPLDFLFWGIPIAIVAVLAHVIIADETRFDPYTDLASSA